MPINTPISQADFQTLVTPIIALLSFYSDGLVDAICPPDYQNVSTGGEATPLCLRYRLKCDFFRRDTALDPYIMILLKGEDRGEAVTFAVEHSLQIVGGCYFSNSELVMTGSSSSPRAKYHAKVAQLIHKFASAGALSNRHRALLRDTRATRCEGSFESAHEGGTQ